MKSIKSKMILVYTALILVITIGLGGIAIYNTISTIDSDTEKGLVSAAKEASKLVAANLDREKLYMEAMAENQLFTNDTGKSEIERFVEEKIEEKSYLSIAYADNNGHATYYGTDETKNISDKTYFQEALEGNTLVSDIQVDESNEEKGAYFVFAAPVMSDGTVTGVLLGEKPTAMLNQYITEVEYKGLDSIRGFIVGLNGDYQAHPESFITEEQHNILELDKVDFNLEKDANGNDISEKDQSPDEVIDLYRQEISKGESGYGEHSFGGIDTLVSFAPIEGKDWMLALELDKSEIYGFLNRLMVILAVSTILFIIIGIIVTYYGSRSLTKPIQHITSSIDQLSNYDLTKEVEEELLLYENRRDEIGTMAKALSRMRTNFVDLIQSTGGLAEHVSASSEELSATTQQASATANEVATTINEISTGASEQANDTEQGLEHVQQLGDLIQKNQDYVASFAQSTNNVNQLKEAGLESLNDLIQKTEHNTKSIADIKDNIVTTNESVDKIATASQMIKSISEQTNLLALNAAIEASRAGEAGQGFAVVADEVRKLAEQSNQFTEEIVGIIEELTTKTENTVKTMELVDQNTSSQEQSLGRTSDQFTGIASAIEEMQATLEHIVKSGESMEEKKQQIVNLIENLSAISEENAASTDQASTSVEEQKNAMNEIATASDELARLTEEMQASIAKFNL
ncbi:methyl-accepting chemotaxis protein [Gracilibacillus sp. S3-1-1]|uniref:Methyl-accepting chemotaxis protein n=1 Tax=Gracilibacillus pellucidus TaxID=3095368 RepID=A0ACC6M2U8_9BACI|nr:methyl-accepting chemotaxis protein [Gracilibacillus sp. S3-1-1]MDX8045262.1 methyl-accepting chemotaxis protein [Gracilibacillus sp. S3-1-1]